MDELYELIESKIKASGYSREINGYNFYNELSDLISEKENGTYILLSKPFDDVIFSYNVTILDDQFDLSTLDINSPEGDFHIDFDA